MTKQRFSSEFLLSRRSAGIVALGAVLSACGGDGGDASVLPPKITTQPQNATVDELAAVSFTVGLEDKALASFQWFKNGSALSGATSQTLQIEKASRTDDGAVFHVLVSNAAGSIQSNSATLTVIGAPNGFGTVQPSDWSNVLPKAPINVTPIPNRVMVGASGIIYLAADDGNTIQKFQSNGARLDTITLPADSSRSTQFLIAYTSIVEDSASQDVYITQMYLNDTGMSNTSSAGGGRVLRVNSGKGEVSVICQTPGISPGGLAQDRDGSLYVIDIKTLDILKINPVSSSYELVFKNTSYQPSPVPWDFNWYPNFHLAVVGDTFFAGSAPESQIKGLFCWNRKTGVATSMPNFFQRVDNICVGQNYAYLMSDSGADTLLYKINELGAWSLAAGTAGSNTQTQFGSPGTLQAGTRLVGITADGVAHLEGSGSPRFCQVALPPQIAPST